MSEYHVLIKGEPADDDGLSIDMGAVGRRSWWDVPLPPCPDCGGDLVWYEAGYVPGTRKCIGEPIGGRVTNPIMDRRVPYIGLGGDDDVRNGRPPRLATWERLRILSLYGERSVCDDGRVAEIDAELLRLLDGSIQREYLEDGGCGSMFSVKCADGRAALCREQFSEKD